MYKPQDCIHVTSFLLWLSVLNFTITVVWCLVILGTLGSQRFSRILEETLDIISFMRVHCDTWDNGRGHYHIGVVLGNVFVQIPFPKHLLTPRTPYGQIWTGYRRFWIFPVCRLPSTFVRGCQGPVGFRLVDQLTIVWTVVWFWSQTTCNTHPWCLGPFLGWHHANFKYRTIYMGTQVWALCSVQTNHPHFLGHVQPYVVALPWNPPENCGTLRIHRLKYNRFFDLAQQLCRAAAYHAPAAVIFHLCGLHCKMSLTNSLYTREFPKILRIPALDHTTSLCAGIHPLCAPSLRVRCVSWGEVGMFVNFAWKVRDLYRLGMLWLNFFATNFLYWSKTSFCCTQNPIHCDCLSFRLVSWLVDIWYYFWGCMSPKQKGRYHLTYIHKYTYIYTYMEYICMYI